VQHNEYQPPDPLLNAEESAAECGLSVPAFWKGVKAGRLPKPVYPASRAPRWRRSELHAALEATRATPREAMEKRRQAKLAKLEAQR
jgi:predicted DNA-binding transcriptional regulator AlpA